MAYYLYEFELELIAETKVPRSKYLQIILQKSTIQGFIYFLKINLIDQNLEGFVNVNNKKAPESEDYH